MLHIYVLTCLTHLSACFSCFSGTTIASSSNHPLSLWTSSRPIRCPARSREGGGAISAKDPPLGWQSNSVSYCSPLHHVVSVGGAGVNSADLLIDFIPLESHFIILCVFNPCLTTALQHSVCAETRSPLGNYQLLGVCGRRKSRRGRDSVHEMEVLIHYADAVWVDE